MKILIAWDDPAEVIQLYLTTVGNEVLACAGVENFLSQIAANPWDAVLMSLTFPATPDEGYAAFQAVQRARPGLPVVLACRPTETLHLARFLNHGLRFHLSRDNQADFVFLVQSSLEAAATARRSEESHRLYERLRTYLAE